MYMLWSWSPWGVQSICSSEWCVTLGLCCYFSILDSQHTVWHFFFFSSFFPPSSFLLLVLSSSFFFHLPHWHSPVTLFTFHTLYLGNPLHACAYRASQHFLAALPVSVKRRRACQASLWGIHFAALQSLILNLFRVYKVF